MRDDSLLTLFVCGDVMTGRGVDQALPHPGNPRIHESYATSARMYVELAERANGPIPRPVGFSYIWGDALADLARADARIINLETSITRTDDYCRDKGINYRMHPDNVHCVTAARVDCCVLANNHVLDYGPAGLVETLATLAAAGVRTAGAGRSLAEARAPAVIEVARKGRVIVFGLGTGSSGIPPDWAATEDRPGIDRLDDLSSLAVDRIRDMVRSVRRPGDVVIVSIHWGDNWGFDVPEEQIRFGHELIRSGVDLVHGHSSHHVRPLEVFEGKLVLYGCGDFLNDYEGIAGHESFRSDLALAYFATIDPFTGRLVNLRMSPNQIKHFRVNRASPGDAAWLRDTINRESRRYHTRVELGEDLHLAIPPGQGRRP